METKNAAAEKSIAVDHLTFGAKTAQRVGWESWEFTVVGSHQIRVTNASYGYLKDDHSYVIGVEVRDGLTLPAECECPADQYNEDYACKHRVSLATVDGPTVLNAAVGYEPPATTEPVERETIGDKIRADGGRPGEDACPNGEIGCAGSDGDDLPYFACFSLAEGDR